MIEDEQRRQELIIEAAKYRLVKEAGASKPKARGTSKILALIGKELVTLGTSLEEHYRIQPETEVAENRKSSPGRS
jgi:hypothetical protein